MPTIYYPVEGAGVNILKTVTDQVVGGLLAELGLTKTFANSVYTMSNFMASSQYSDNNGSPTMTKNRCDVEVSYVMDASQVPWPIEIPYNTPAYGVRSSNKGHHTPILIDTEANILIEHWTSACALEMAFTLTFETFDEASKTFDTIQNRYKGSLTQTPYSLAFSYPVSMDLYKFLTTVYAAKTDYKTKSFLDYINDTKRTQISFDVRKSQITDPNADVELMVRCQQIQCVAQLTRDQKEPDVIRKDDVPIAYTINFSLALQFGRPTMIAVNTPVSVDNTELPRVLFQQNLANFHDNPAVGGVYSDLMIQEFMSRSNGSYKRASQIVRLPLYDDWFTVDSQYAYYEYRPFLIAHFTLDGAVTTINLRQLDQVVLHPVVQSILAEMGNTVFGYGGIFTVGVYANDLRLGPTLLNLDADLNLTITSIRPDKVYHLVLSESTSLYKMNNDSSQMLVRYRYFFPLTIERNLNNLIKKRILYIGTDNRFLSVIAKLQKTGKLKAILLTMVSLGEDTNEIFSYTQNPSQLADYMAYTQSKRRDYTLPVGTDPATVLVLQYYALNFTAVPITVDPNTAYLRNPDGSYMTRADGALVTVSVSPTALTGGYAYITGLDNKPILDANGNFVTIPYAVPASPTDVPPNPTTLPLFNRSLLVAFIEQCLLAGYTTLDIVSEQYISPTRTVFPYYPGQGGYYGFNTPLRVLNFKLTTDSTV